MFVIILHLSSFEFTLDVFLCKAKNLNLFQRILIQPGSSLNTLPDSQTELVEVG